jgi:hypothetical protein
LKNIGLHVEALPPNTLMTDYQMFKINVPLVKMEHDFDLRNMPTYVKAAEIRTTATSD